MNNNTLYLIDGHSLTFKAYYAIRGLRGPQGQPTGAVFGFLRMLLKFMDDWSPRCLAVVFDTGKPTFRKDLYQGYKANREGPPPDFAEQMEWIHQLMGAMGLAIYHQDGFEADDLIATMAEQMKAAGREAVIVSADKDLLQLVNSHISVLRPGINELKLVRAEEVEQILGVRPEQVVDWLALVGDSSDNIPGVPGIGEKTAVELLRQFGSLDTLLARAAELAKPRFREALQNNMEQARMARLLATVRRDVPLTWDPCHCNLPENLWTAPALALMRQLGFQSVLKERGISAPESPPSPADPAAPPAVPIEYRAITSEATLSEWVEKAMKAEWVALDTETTMTDVMQGDLVGISLADAPGRAIYLPLGHRPEMCHEGQLPLSAARRILEPLLGGRGPKLTAHHAKFDWKMLRRAGFDPAPPAFDTMIASYLLDPDKASGHGLKTLGRECCNVEMTPIIELIGRGKRQITMAEVPVDDVTPYACRDADVTWSLTEILSSRLAEQPPLHRLLEQVELPLLMVLVDMEMGGFNIAPEVFGELGGQVERSMNELARRIWSTVGHPFNLASSRQLAQVLYEELKLKPGKTGKTGYSTDETELERLANEHDVARFMLEYRMLEKLKSTYIDALPKLVHPKTGQIHTSFHQTTAATGRLSSTDPNLQNIPIRTDLGRGIRRAFVADGPGQVLVKADYSQIELRILAHVSRDATLCAAYQEGRDIHRQTASQVFGVAPEEVNGEMRAQAKVINFGIIYGMSAHGLAQQLGIPRGEAAGFIERYFATYPGVRQWIDRLLEEARRTGWVETMMGRRRMVPDVRAANRMLRANAERIAVNTPIQGTCADMIKVAMIRLHRELPTVAPGGRMVCQVHDELVFTIPRQCLAEAEALIRRVMCGALELCVPVEVGIYHAANWAECG